MFKQALRIGSRSMPRLAVAAAARPALVASGVRAFSSTVYRRSDESEVLKTLKQEIVYEEDIAKEKDDDSAQIEDFLESNEFRAVSKDNSSMIDLVKETDKYIVTASFDVRSVISLTDMQEFKEDNEDDEFAEEFPEDEFSTLSVVVAKKSDNSALLFDCTLKFSDLSVAIDNITPFADAQDALEDSASAVHKRNVAYSGPPFQHYDENLQASVEDWFQSLGINSAFVEFILFYSEKQEVQKYRAWLKRMESFYQ